MSIVSAFLAYKFADLLARPFKDWDAFELGLIDQTGQIIRQPVLTHEKNALGIFEKMIRKLKITINLLVGESRAAAILSTLYLLKEYSSDEIFKTTVSEVRKTYPELDAYLNRNRYQILFEQTLSSDIIPRGSYKFVCGIHEYFFENSEFELIENLIPKETVFGIPIYELSKNQYITKEMICKI